METGLLAWSEALKHNLTQLLGIVASLLEETIAKAKVGFFTHLIYRNGLNTGNGVTLHDTF